MNCQGTKTGNFQILTGTLVGGLQKRMQPNGLVNELTAGLSQEQGIIRDLESAAERAARPS